MDADHYNTGLPYTAAEEAFLRQHYADSHNLWLEQRLGRSHKSIRNKAVKMGLAKSPEQRCRRWA